MPPVTFSTVWRKGDHLFEVQPIYPPNHATYPSTRRPRIVDSRRFELLWIHLRPMRGVC